VQRAADLPVAGARQAVPDVLAGRGVDRRGYVLGREVGHVREAGDVTDLDQQPSRPRGSDALQLGERAAGSGEELAQFLVGGLLALVNPLKVTEQLGSDPLAYFRGRIPWPDLRQ
jgi:hypothetical protein